MEQKKDSFSKEGLPILFALIAIAVMVMVKIILAFGVNINVFNGIMCIIYLALPIIGATFAYVGNRNLRSFEFLFNLSVLALGLLMLLF